GFPNYISKEGTRYYSELIDALLEKGIEPVVTLYHWELPQRLQDLGGWTNPLVSDWFANYARIVFSLYGDRVKTWITINEPLVKCDLAYQTGILAPGIISPEVGSLLCSKHVLVAHAKAWRVYDEEFRAKYHGLLILYYYSYYLYFSCKAPAEGGWPPAVEKVIAAYSKKLGYPRSNLPSLSKEETELLKVGSYAKRRKKHPEGFRKQLTWIKKEYGDVLLAIKEDGVNVTAFTAWSLMDSFEWMHGYTIKFGLYEVDFRSPDRTRTPRASAFYYSSVIKSNSLNVPEDIGT
ncbi:Uncharacterized protein OBRU01_21782, partial [Operophtera brumata]